MNRGVGTEREGGDGERGVGTEREGGKRNREAEELELEIFILQEQFLQNKDFEFGFFSLGSVKNPSNN